MDVVKSHVQVVTSMKASTRTTKNTDMVNTHGQMPMSTKASGEVIKEMDEVNTDGQMEASMKASGKLVILMDLAKRFTRMATSIKENGKRTINTGKVYSNIRTRIVLFLFCLVVELIMLLLFFRFLCVNFQSVHLKKKQMTLAMNSRISTQYTSYTYVLFRLVETSIVET